METGRIASTYGYARVSTDDQNEDRYIRTRQREGIAAAQARGVKFGRPMLDPPPCFDEVVRRYRSREITVRTAASLCGMSPTSFWRKSSALGVPT